MQRIAAGFFGVLLIGTVLLSGRPLYAKEYLGFSPGTQTWDEVILTLKSANAVYDPNWGYKGYMDLPFVKVISYEKFNKFGQVKEAWLEFTPDKKLYRIKVTWENAGKTFKILKDALDTKYGQPAIPGMVENMGFQKEFYYRDHEIKITLKLNEFGFAPTTTLIYTYTPGTSKFENEKKRIEAYIRQQNARKAGSDL